MQRCPLSRLGWKVEGHSRSWTSLFVDRVMGVGQVSSCCSYQGGDHVWAQWCTVSVLMWSIWLGDSGGSPLVGCSRNMVNLEKHRKGNNNSFEINSVH